MSSIGMHHYYHRPNHLPNNKFLKIWENKRSEDRIRQMQIKILQRSPCNLIHQLLLESLTQPIKSIRPRLQMKSQPQKYNRMLNKRDQEKETRRKSGNQRILISHRGATLNTSPKWKMTENKPVRHLGRKIELKNVQIYSDTTICD